MNRLYLATIVYLGFSVSCVNHRDISVRLNEDQTYKILCDTVIPLVDWPEQPLVERLALIHQEASKVGLSVKMSEGVRKGTAIYPALAVRNIPLNAAIQYTVDSTKLRFIFKDSGVIYFFLQHERA